jgi:hypothetical protein
MSWLNLNDSLNSLKGQISNFASNVLADEDQHTDASNINKDITELQKICTDQQEEVSVYIIHIIFIYLANGLFFQRSVLHHS